MVDLTNHLVDGGHNSMAAVATQTIPTQPLPRFTPIIKDAGAQDSVEHAVAFDPKIHLAYGTPSKIHMMKDLGYAEGTGVSPIAVSEPFQLFTPSAIEAMRAEILKPEIHEKFKYSSNIAPCQLRGYAKDHAPFSYAAWNHPETLANISGVAGIELIPAFDYEIGNINFSVKTEAETRNELDIVKERRGFYAKDDGVGACPWEDKPIVGWHTDSYPFVCVLMMSDCTNMVGGETAVRTADGAIIRVRCPTQGWAVVLQGRYVTHQAMRALGMRERISSVTSFRPKSLLQKDDTVLRTVRPVSDVSELYYSFANYRLEMMEERIRHERQKMTDRRNAGQKFDTVKHKKFLAQSQAFVVQTSRELVEESKIKKGFIEGNDTLDTIGGS